MSLPPRIWSHPNGVGDASAPPPALPCDNIISHDMRWLGSRKCTMYEDNGLNLVKSDLSLSNISSCDLHRGYGAIRRGFEMPRRWRRRHPMCTIYYCNDCNRVQIIDSCLPTTPSSVMHRMYMIM